MKKKQPQIVQKPDRNLELFAEWFVRSPLATQMHSGALQFQTFQALKCREEERWTGVEITIAWVGPEGNIDLKDALPPPTLGNGHSSNPRGLLKPGDFGVHSHPDTAKLMTGRRAGD